MWIVKLALRRPYTFVVMAFLIAILGGAGIVTMPVDIFPYIDIPVVCVVWYYPGVSPEEMEKRFPKCCSLAKVSNSESDRPRRPITRQLAASPLPGS